MAPLTPTWKQPSHPGIQTVIFSENYTTKSISKISLPPFGLFAKLDFPPCTVVAETEKGATYATVQMGREKHLNLNSDLVYINHGCVPSLIFDIPSLSLVAGPHGLQVGEELTFFYPSTEWDMAQPFDCFCGAATCRGRISGAKHMTPAQLQGQWLNPWIRNLLEERDGVPTNGSISGSASNGIFNGAGKKYMNGNGASNGASNGNGNAEAGSEIERSHNGDDGFGGVTASSSSSATGKAGPGRGGPTSRELSGEMGGDTSSSA